MSSLSEQNVENGRRALSESMEKKMIGRHEKPPFLSRGGAKWQSDGRGQKGQRI
jgi:hypothetical protein